jgi:hypothetical protein
LPGQLPEVLPERTAELWLASIDAGDYAESYDQAAQYFKTAVAKDEWQKSLQAARAPLGKVLSRKLKSATHAKTLPGSPDGEYVVILYETRFEQKQSAVETVTTMLDKDGMWKVSGYYIK